MVCFIIMLDAVQHVISGPTRIRCQQSALAHGIAHPAAVRMCTDGLPSACGLLHGLSFVLYVC
jgi:hypothetical protein